MVIAAAADLRRRRAAGGRIRIGKKVAPAQVGPEAPDYTEEHSAAVRTPPTNH
jgi:hypothetical protein